MTWTRPEAPRALPGRCTPQVVAGAVVTGFGRHRLATIDPPAQGMVGAVHRADGSLVESSQRRWTRENPGAPIAVDPPSYVVGALGDDVPLIRGRWIYAGHWTRHFGHFLIETLPNLWPARESPDVAGPHGVDGILTHRSFRGPIRMSGHAPGAAMTVPDWQERLLELAGWGGLPVRAVQGDDVRVEELVVPGRPLVFRAAAGPEAVALWQRIGRNGARASTPTRVFWSRSEFNRARRSATGSDGRRPEARTSPAWDAYLDSAFSAAGFAVVHPQHHPVEEQIALAHGAEVMAGSSGSALHLSAVAGPGCRVLEIGDARGPDAPQTSQVMIDAACGHETAFAAYADRVGLEQILSDL